MERAIKLGKWNEVSALLQTGPKPSQQIFVHALNYRAPVDIIRLMIDKGCSVSSKENGNPPLFYVVGEQQFDVDVFNLLLEKGANINTRGNSNTSLLAFSIARGTLGAINAILDTPGLQVDKYVVRPLLRFYERFPLETETLKKLINSGYDVDQSQGALLASAIEAPNTDLLKLLLEIHVDPNVVFSNGLFPLNKAMTIRPNELAIEMTHLLLANGADASRENTRIQTASQYAAAEGVKPEQISELLRMSNINLFANASRTGRTGSALDDLPMDLVRGVNAMLALDPAVLRLKEKITQDRWADVRTDLINMDKGTKLPGMLVLAAKRLAPLFIIEQLVEKLKCNINEKEDNGCSVLYHAVWNAFIPETVEFLLRQKGIDVNAKNKNGISIIACAFDHYHHPGVLLALLDVDRLAFDGDLTRINGKVLMARLCTQFEDANIAQLDELIPKLVAKGYNLNVDHGAPLVSLVERGSIRILEMFLSSGGLDYDLPMAGGLLPLNMVLITAPSAHTQSFLKLLMDRGADLGRKNWFGQTALEYAETKPGSRLTGQEYKTIIAFLKSYRRA